MALTAEDVWGFSTVFLKPQYDEPVNTPKFHAELWELCCSPAKKVAIAAPRRHAKSTAVTLAYALAELLFRESKFLLIASAGEKTSVDFLNSIKKELIENTRLRKEFKIKRFVKESDHRIEVEFQDGEQFCAVVTGAGPGIRVRGIKWGNLRPDLIIGDDLEEDESVLNPDRREKFRKWFFDALVKCLSKKGKIRVVGTILHMDSLLERLMPERQLPESLKEEAGKWIVRTELSVKSKYKEAIWKSVRYRAHTGPGDFSSILWPEQHPQESLEEEYQEAVREGNPEGYSKEFLNDPIDTNTAYFKKEDFKEIDYEIHDSEVLQYYIGTDFALSLKQRADYSVFVVIGVTSDGRFKVVEVRKGRMEISEIVDNFFTLTDKYTPEMFILEKGSAQIAVEQSLVKEAEEVMGFMPPIDSLNPGQDKRIRARPMQMKMRAGKVEFDKEASWYGPFEEELRRFDKGVNDDQVDAFGIVGLYMKNITYAPTEYEMEEDRYRRDVKSSTMFQGRSRICGY